MNRDRAADRGGIVVGYGRPASLDFDEAGRDAVHGDSMRAEFERESADQRLEPAFGCGVDRPAGERDAGVD